MERELAFFKEDGMKPDNDFQRVIAALDASGLRFVIIGGIAMRLQGASHITDDIGFARDPHSLGALVSALAPCHPRLRGAPAGLPFCWDLRTLQTSVNMTLETDAGSVDLVGEPDGVASFEDLWGRGNAHGSSGRSSSGGLRGGIDRDEARRRSARRLRAPA